MFPILLLSRDEKKTNSFIEEFIKEKKYHPSDVYRFYPEETRIKIETIRTITSLFSRSYQNKIMVIVYGFETARDETQNAFLKTLEEKNTTAQFILVAQDETQMLKTIVSRCKIVKISSRAINLNKKNIPDFSISLAQLLRIYSGIKKEKAGEILDTWLWYFKEKLAVQSSASRILKEILRVRSLLLKNNLNAQIAVDHVLITIHKCQTSS